MDTYSANEQDIEREWWHVDLEGEVLGRAASEIATLLQGKHKPIYTPHVDCGDFVVCTNCEKIELTGDKLEDKMYQEHTGHPGGLKEMSAEELLEYKPEAVVEYAVKGMLPKNKLAREMFKKLKVYAGPEHPHDPQSPKSYT
ncbi:MAG: 50S ribosomal protein L13, partial [Bradymonadaceae bacterium]